MTAIAGVKFSDSTAALLDEALAQGFRIENKTKSSVICYSPDPTKKPVVVSERPGVVSANHTANVRANLRKAGLDAEPTPTPVGDQITRERRYQATKTRAVETLEGLPEASQVAVKAIVSEPGGRVDLNALEAGDAALREVMTQSYVGLEGDRVDLAVLILASIKVWQMQYVDQSKDVQEALDLAQHYEDLARQVNEENDKLMVLVERQAAQLKELGPQVADLQARTDAAEAKVKGMRAAFSALAE